MALNISLKQNYPQFQTHVIKTLETAKILTKEGKEKLLNASTLEDFDYYIKDYINYDLLEKTIQTIDSDPILKDAAKKTKFTLEIQKIFYKLLTSFNEKLTKLATILTEKDIDPLIIELKKEIQKDFGVKELYCDNDINFAKNCYEALNILHMNNLQIPERIVACRYLPFSISGYAFDMSTILLETEFNFQNQSSTQKPYHHILHKSMHTNQPNIIGLGFKKIPKQFKKTVDNLSQYASNNAAQEIHAELLCKKFVLGLTPKEKDLLKFLEK